MKIGIFPALSLEIRTQPTEKKWNNPRTRKNTQAYRRAKNLPLYDFLRYKLMSAVVPVSQIFLPSSSFTRSLSVIPHPFFYWQKPGCGSWRQGSPWEGDCICDRLTLLAPERVVLWEDRVGVLHSSSSNKPVHVGIPAVHKATEMVFFKVTFWRKKHRHACHGPAAAPGDTHTWCGISLRMLGICFIAIG